MQKRIISYIFIFSLIITILFSVISLADPIENAENEEETEEMNLFEYYMKLAVQRFPYVIFIWVFYILIWKLRYVVFGKRSN